MKRGKLLLVFGLLFMFLVLNMVFVSADLRTDANDCTVTQGGTVLFDVSDISGNAHAAVPSDITYTAVACLDGVSGTIDETGATGNPIIKLSGTTNAHVGQPATSSYTTIISSADITCTYGATCDTIGGEVCVASVSGTIPPGIDNAHVGTCTGPGAYGTLLCCSLSAAPPTCGNGVIDTGQGEVCDIGPDLTSGTADDVLGGLTCSDFPPLDSGTLGCAAGCLSFNTNQCLDTLPDRYWAQTNGIALLGNPAQLNVSIGSTKVLMVYKDPSLSLIIGNPYTFEIYERDVIFDEKIRTVLGGNEITGIATTNNEVNATWTILQEDINAAGLDDLNNFEFEVDGATSDQQLSLTILEETFFTCADYPQSICGFEDPANVAETSVEANFPEINCGLSSEINPNTGCMDFTLCECFWNATQNECGPKAILSDQQCPSTTYYIGDVGTCFADENTGDTCDDGFLTYSWIANFVFDSTNDNLPLGTGGYDPADNNYVENPVGSGNWHYDPFINPTTRKSETCVDGSNTLECPAQIQLPFFTFLNFVIVVIVFVIIYSVINSRNKARKKPIKNRKKRK